MGKTLQIEGQYYFRTSHCHWYLFNLRWVTRLGSLKLYVSGGPFRLSVSIASFGSTVRFHFGTTIPFQLLAAHMAQQGLWNLMIDNFLLPDMNSQSLPLTKIQIKSIVHNQQLHTNIWYPQVKWYAERKSRGLKRAYRWRGPGKSSRWPFQTAGWSPGPRSSHSKPSVLEGMKNHRIWSRISFK